MEIDRCALDCAWQRPAPRPRAQPSRVQQSPPVALRSIPVSGYVVASAVSSQSESSSQLSHSQGDSALVWHRRLTKLTPHHTCIHSHTVRRRCPAVPVVSLDGRAAERGVARLRRGRIVVRAYRLYCTTYAVRLGTDYSTLEVSRTRTRYDRAKTETVSAVMRGELFRSVINASRSNLQALTV